MVAERPRRVQDDAREAALARMLDLVVSNQRTGPDAHDEANNPYELKTTTTSSVGTGRDIGLSYLRAMRTRYWVAARGHQTAYGFAFEEIYFLHPTDLEAWITVIEDRLAADVAIVDRAAEALAARGRPEAEVTRLRYLGARGLTLNNPKISWAYVQSHGTRLGEHPQLDLRTLVAERPLVAPAVDADGSAPIPGTPLPAEPESGVD